VGVGACGLEIVQPYVASGPLQRFDQHVEPRVIAGLHLFPAKAFDEDASVAAKIGADPAAHGFFGPPLTPVVEKKNCRAHYTGSTVHPASMMSRSGGVAAGLKYEELCPGVGPSIGSVKHKDRDLAIAFRIDGQERAPELDEVAPRSGSSACPRRAGRNLDPRGSRRS